MIFYELCLYQTNGAIAIFYYVYKRVKMEGELVKPPHAFNFWLNAMLMVTYKA